MQTLSGYVNDEQAERVRRSAAWQHKTVSQVLREAIDAYFDIDDLEYENDQLRGRLTLVLRKKPTTAI
jgi:predicted DNA-binding protein